MNNEILETLTKKFNLSKKEQMEMASDIDSLMQDAIEQSKKEGNVFLVAPQRINNKHFKVVIEVDVVKDFFRLDIAMLTIDEYLDFMNDIKATPELKEIKK